MEHSAVLAEDLAPTREFYRPIPGLEEGYRPPLGFPGVWLYAGGRAILHVIARRALPESRAGVLDHMAFAARGLPGGLAQLAGRGLAYALRRQIQTHHWQLLFPLPHAAHVAP